MNQPDDSSDGKPWEPECRRRWFERRALWAEAAPPLTGKLVLDAGTGEGHFTRFLAEQSPAKVVSVTCVPDEIEPARRRLGELADLVNFELADLTDLRSLADSTFDVVAADFLIAAVAAYSPFREAECVKELHRVLKPGGRIMFTGWEVGAAPTSRTGRVVRALSRLRDAAHALNDEPAYREHPSEWIERRLADLGSPAERTVRRPDVHRDFRWFVDNTRRAVANVQPPALRAELERRLDELADLLESDPAFAKGFEFGRLYAVVACKLAGGLILGG